MVINLINQHETEYDYILLDSPGGISKVILNINAYSQHRFFVVTPDKSSITDSYSLMKLLKLRYGVRHHFLIVNRFVAEKQYQRVVKTITNTVENFLGSELSVLGGVRKE
jgi:flagellar biosynthesis protein FlhG